MKQVLSLLMAFVFLQTQSWALSGGPFGGSGSGGSLTGSYAGVLIPEVAPVVGTATSIGLFTLLQPDSGFTTGAISVFVDGVAYLGTITGVMDPKDGAFRGVIDAASTLQIQTPVQTTQIVNGIPVTTTTIQNSVISAQGSIEAIVAADIGANAFQTSTSSATRVEGTATIDISPGFDPATGTPIVTQTVVFLVDGFKQADS